MKIISWNVNGIRAIAKKGFLEFFEREDPDILCLQETKAHPDQLDALLINPFERESFWSAAEKKGYSGTVTYVRERPADIKYGCGVKKFDSEGRFVVTDHSDFLLYNVYFPNGSSGEERHQYKQDFLDRFRKHVAKDLKSGREVIVVGDYNVAYMDIDVFDPVRLSKVSGFLPDERKWFGQFLETGFIDAFRYFHPDQKEAYSWWSYQETARISNRGWRIDHICVSEGLKKRLKSCTILDQILGSDHAPVVLELK